tara:strand:+ start:752 stop:1036 length:285 start_codon:yes stop_codon:yes gene_type:complete
MHSLSEEQQYQTSSKKIAHTIIRVYREMFRAAVFSGSISAKVCYVYSCERGVHDEAFEAFSLKGCHLENSKISPLSSEEKEEGVARRRDIREEK